MSKITEFNLMIIFAQACVWFSIGVFWYFYMLNGKGFLALYLRSKKDWINSKSWFQWILMYYVLCIIWLLFNNLVYYMFVPNINLDTIYESVLYSTNPGKEGSSTSTGLGLGSKGAIMATALAAGSKVAQSTPSIAGKLAVVGIGAAAIAAKNIAGNVSENIGKSINELVPSSSNNVNSFAVDLFNLSGDSIKDLLILIQAFGKFEIGFLYLILYYLILLTLNIELIEKYLLRVFPQYIVNKLIIPIKLFKKNGIYIILTLVILSLIAAHLSVYYLGFFIDNIEGIYEFIKKR